MRSADALRRAIAEAELLPPEERLVALEKLAAEAHALYEKTKADGDALIDFAARLHRFALWVVPEADPIHDAVAHEFSTRTDWKLPEL
jgi:hypothetical protein